MMRTAIQVMQRHGGCVLLPLPGQGAQVADEDGDQEGQGGQGET